MNLRWFHALLILLLLIMAPRTLATRGVLLWKKRLAIAWWRKRFAPKRRFYVGQFALRATFWILVAVVLQASIPSALFDRSEYVEVMATIWTLAVVLVLLDLFPSATLRVSTFVGFGLATLCLVIQLLLFYTDPSGGVDLDPPVRGEWYVGQGGRGSLFNHHYPRVEQSHALDMVRAEGRTFKGDSTKLESYFAWDQDILAPGDGVIVKVMNDLPDEEIGSTNTATPEGNSIVLRVGDRYVLLAHLKKGSVRVAVGESVKSGQVLAKCGNSGNASEPHLHIQVQSHADTWDDASRTFPIRFTKGVGYLRRNDRPNFGP